MKKILFLFLAFVFLMAPVNAFAWGNSPMTKEEIKAREARAKADIKATEARRKTEIEADKDRRIASINANEAEEKNEAWADKEAAQAVN